jgi:uncharacterized membrane protein
MGLHFVMMNNRSPALPSLMRYLLTWFVGCAIAMVFAYTELLDYYLSLGVELRHSHYSRKQRFNIQQARKKGRNCLGIKTSAAMMHYQKFPPKF